MTLYGFTLPRATIKKFCRSGTFIHLIHTEFVLYNDGVPRSYLRHTDVIIPWIATSSWLAVAQQWNCMSRHFATHNISSEGNAGSLYSMMQLCKLYKPPQNLTW